MVGVRREDGLLVVAALGDVKPIARRGETGFAGHEKDPPLNSGFSRGKFSYIFCGGCGNFMRFSLSGWIGPIETALYGIRGMPVDGPEWPGGAKRGLRGTRKILH